MHLFIYLPVLSFLLAAYGSGSSPCPVPRQTHSITLFTKTVTPTNVTWCKPEWADTLLEPTAKLVHPSNNTAGVSAATLTMTVSAPSPLCSRIRSTVVAPPVHEHGDPPPCAVRPQRAAVKGPQTKVPLKTSPT